MDIYYTSDTHSYVYPEDYTGTGAKNMGYMAAASQFRPGSLVIDGGDLLQGSPLLRFEMKTGIKDHLAIRAFNAANLDIYVPGNHDFDYGYEGVKNLREKLNADFICANLIDLRGLIKPQRWTVIERDCLKVFVTGVVTDYVNVWDRDKLDGLEIADCFQSTAEAYKASLDLDADFRICVYHGGFGQISEGELNENIGSRLAEIGFDLLLTAHQHRVIQPHTEGRSLVLQAGSKAEHFAHIRLEKGKKPEAEIISADFAHPLTPALEALKESDSTRADVAAFLKKEVGFISGELEDSGRIESFVHGSSLADFINDLQLSLSDADISAAALVNKPVSLKDRVTMFDLLSAYPFSNTLTVLKINALMLKQALERSAEFVDYADGKLIESPYFSPEKDERYNCDFFRGLAYTFDLSRPHGDRVVKMEHKGIDLLKHSSKELKIVLNSYRASGTGGYDCYRGLEVVSVISTEIQDALISKFESDSPIMVPEKTEYRVLF